MGSIHNNRNWCWYIVAVGTALATTIGQPMQHDEKESRYYRSLSIKYLPVCVIVHFYLMKPSVSGPGAS